jgi:hypothetical protein
MALALFAELHVRDFHDPDGNEIGFGGAPL